MANQYDTNLKLQAIADAIGNSSSSGLISALEDIADAVAGGGGGGSSTAGLVSDNFSETDTYDLGDYCIHNNTLYVCINAITTPGPWDLSDWQATNAGIQLSSLNSALTTQEISPTATTSACAFIKIVKCGKLVSIFTRANITTANTPTEVATLPSSIAPSANYANASDGISTFAVDGTYTNFGVISIDLSTNKVIITGNATGLFNGLIQYLID